LTSRLTAGEVARSDVDSARVDLANTQLAIRTAEGHLSETKTTLGAVIGVPVAALEAVQFRWPDFDRPPGADSLLPQTVQRDALLNRLDVRNSLAEYAAAEADLQLEIAKQYPDIDIGPGYTYEERNSFFTVGLAITLPIRNRNQGPIAEAEARRKEAAARFLGTQARVIVETETALASYRAALAELSQAEESLSRVHEPRERVTRASVTLGESDPLTLNDVQLQGLAAMQAKTGALVRTQTALGALEDAVQRPLGGEGPIPQSNPVSLSNSGPKGMKP
jgi:cobalt-zinc-cadmium efflux system outer membrane protein